MKLVMASSVAFFHPSMIFEKPLNPVLGETYQAVAVDGARVFLEQTSHHPPVSHLYMEGPDNRYTVSGWSTYVIRAGMNSATVVSDGHKKVTFHDGHTIKYNNPGDYLYNLFMGTMCHQITGKMEFHDEQNNIYGVYEFGKVKKKTQDYFSGHIAKCGQPVCEVYGNYMGYMDFNKVRYFDVREINSCWRPLKAVGDKAI
jgi:hypothetical protein